MFLFGFLKGYAWGVVNSWLTAAEGLSEGGSSSVLLLDSASAAVRAQASHTPIFFITRLFATTLGTQLSDFPLRLPKNKN